MMSKRLRLSDEAFDVQCNLLTLQIHRDIHLIFACADIDYLHLNEFHNGIVVIKPSLSKFIAVLQ
jgi:hypothetical protein